MKTITGRTLYILMFSMLINTVLNAQVAYKLASVDKLEVTGTSTLHDWSMASHQATGTATITIKEDIPEAIGLLTIKMEAESLKSGKSGMDDKAYKALKTDKYSNISFQLTETKSISRQKDCYLITATGQLTIAGQSRTLSFSVLGYPAKSSIRFAGSKTFKLTDFNIEPPTALMGTVKTGDDVTIHFDLTFKN